MPILEVKCTVSDCFFHVKENFCGAEKIEINREEQVYTSDLTEFAAEFQYASEKAAHSTDTCCKTFRPKKQDFSS